MVEPALFAQWGAAMKAQRGQVTIEYILMAVVIIGFAILVRTGIQRNDILQNMVSQPWLVLQGMVENGTWGRVQRTKPLHPNFLKRHVTMPGETSGP